MLGHKGHEEPRSSQRISPDSYQDCDHCANLVVILLATVASVLWKAAKSNPVEALKYE